MAQLLYGKHTVRSFLESGGNPADVAAVYLAEGGPADLSALVARRLPGVALETLKRRELDQRFPGVRHQGIVLVFRAGKDPTARSGGAKGWRELVRPKSGPLLLLDRLQDPQNLGNVLRSAEALGVRAVFLTGSGASVNDTVHRVSSGASLRLPVFRQSNLHQLVEELKKLEYWICASAAAADLERDAASGHTSAHGKHAPLYLKHTDLARLPPAEEVALVIGSEGDGVKNLVLQHSDFVLSIPLRGSTESLNAAVAAAILLDRVIHRA